MPSDTPGIIFVKIPRFWLKDEKFAADMAELAMEYFRQNRKIVSIKYYTHTIVMEKAWHGDTTGEIIAYQEHSNPNHRFDGLRAKGWQIFPDDPAIAPPERRSFNGMSPRWRRPFFADVFDCANAP